MSVNTKVNGQLVKSAGLYKASVPIQSGDIYSFEERQVGVFADGKPLYQKTVYSSGGNLTNGQIFISNDLANIDHVASWKCVTHDTARDRDYCLDHNRLDATEDIRLQVYVASDDTVALVVLVTKASFLTAIGDTWITLQYTKTTDVAGSGEYVPSGDKAVHYSTEEEVIGTWIDGKTIYRKVIKVTSDINLTANTWVSTGISAPNIHRVIRTELINQSPANVIVSVAIQNDMWSLNSPRTIQLTGASTDWHLILEYTKTS